MTNRIFEVGGSIRDGILGLKSKDRDFCVETDSFESMRNIIVNLGGKVFLETPEHFTIRANVPQLGSADYVLCRKEGEYTDGRHPDWVKVGDLNDDLARRDFTMNAIAKDVTTGEVFDPHSGWQDIDARIVRCVGDPAKRFQEDALRVIRALRFAVTKEFRIEENTENAIHNFVMFNFQRFEATSTPRIREELLKMFSHDSLRSFLLLQSFGLLWLLDKRGIWLKPTIEQRA